MGKIMIIGAAVADVLARPVGPEVFKTGSMAAEDIVLSTGGDGLNEATVLAGLGGRAFSLYGFGRGFCRRNHKESLSNPRNLYGLYPQRQHPVYRNQCGAGGEKRGAKLSYQSLWNA